MARACERALPHTQPHARARSHARPTGHNRRRARTRTRARACTQADAHTKAQTLADEHKHAPHTYRYAQASKCTHI
eukprot:39160-Pleurochrysis_carterae.AAC.1